MPRFRPRLTYSLRTLFALVTVVAIACVIAPPFVSWLFPREVQPDFEELIELITATSNQPTSSSSEAEHLSLTIGTGQHVQTAGESESEPLSGKDGAAKD